MRFGQPDATDEQVWEALTVSGRGFVRELPEGSTRRSTRAGPTFPAAAAAVEHRAGLVRPCPIYIFDDSFSALDYATDARLRTALAQRTRQAAVIIVAQRVSTIRNADQIVVLDRGRVVGSVRTSNSWTPAGRTRRSCTRS